MANQQKGLASESIFRRVSNAVQAVFGLMLEKETWQAVVRWGLWRVFTETPAYP